MPTSSQCVPAFANISAGTSRTHRFLIVGVSQAGDRAGIVGGPGQVLGQCRVDPDSADDLRGILSPYWRIRSWYQLLSL